MVQKKKRNKTVLAGPAQRKTPSAKETRCKNTWKKEKGRRGGDPGAMESSKNNGRQGLWVPSSEKVGEKKKDRTSIDLSGPARD